MADTLFDRFWSNHPSLQTPPENQPCETKGISNHDNQCVIRLGIAMTASGISLASYRGAVSTILSARRRFGFGKWTDHWG